VRAIDAAPATLDPPHLESAPLAKPNYSFEKRQRELAKKKQQDEKDARKREAREAAKGPGAAAASDDPAPVDGTEPTPGG